MTDTTNKLTRERAEEMTFSDEDNVDDMYLTFALGEEEYGVCIADVTEIVGLQKIMPIPDVPDYIRGVINLRGKVIPLTDVRMRFGMKERAYDERTVVIVMEVSDAPIGLIVDGVREVLEIPPTQVDRPSSIGKGGVKSLISGIGRVGERAAILLDASTLISEDDIIVPASIAAE